MTYPEDKELSHYLLRERIGVGGMGEVWLAKDTVLRRTVAIKILRQELAVDELRRRLFVQEARITAALNDVRIAHIYELGKEASLLFTVMEYVEGKPLSDILNGRALPPIQIVCWGQQIAQGLSKAHSKGLIHRDLKPSNVLVTIDEDIKIVDFGLAALFTPPHHAATLAASELSTVIRDEALKIWNSPPFCGAVAGTLPYMSPEQLCGADLDQRTDIFSLGVILYEMTTGRRPFAGETIPALVAEIQRGQPVPPGDAKPSVPPELDRIIRRALAPLQRERYQSMVDLAAELEHLQHHLLAGSQGSRSAHPTAEPTIIPRDRDDQMPVAENTRLSTLSAIDRGKIYVYLSYRKIEMLLAQIPRGAYQNIAADLGVDLALPHANESRVPDQIRYAKAAVVTHYIRRHLTPGTPEMPGPYFAGTVDMKASLIKGEESKYIYFGGQSEKRLIALVGSPGHLVAERADREEGHSRGFSVYLLKFIMDSLGAAARNEIEPAQLDTALPIEALGFYISWINRDVEAPAQRLEFLARRLYESSNAVLGTPIYVALAS